MKKAFYLLMTFLCAQSLHAQKFNAAYFNHSQVVPADTGILISYAKKAPIPFMVKGINPYDRKSNRVGFMDSTRRVIIKPVYSDCSYFINGLALVQDTTSKLKKGVIDTKGGIVIPIKYDWVERCINGLFFVSQNHELALLDKAGNTIIPTGRYIGFSTPWPVYTEGNDMPDQRYYWTPLWFNNNVQFEKYIGVNTGKKWAVINRNGKEIVPPMFDQIWPFNGDLAPAKIERKVGVINTAGNIVIPALYNKVELSGKNFMYVTADGKTGVLTIGNKLVIPMEYEHIATFADGFTAYDNNYNAVLFNALGKRISNPVYNPRIEFPFWGQEGDFWVYNKATKQFNPYQDIREIKNNRTQEKLFFFQKENKWGLMDSTGVEFTGPLFDELDDNTLNYFEKDSPPLIIVQQGGKSGIIDFKGKLRLPALYDKIINDNGKLIVIDNNKYGVLNKTLKKPDVLKYDSIAITHLYDTWGSVSNLTTTSARIGGKWALLNNNGKEITDFKYDRFLWFFHGLGLVKINGKTGLINARGKQLAACKYDDITFVPDNVQTGYYNHYLVFKNASFYGVMDSTGKEISPAIYDRIMQTGQPLAKKYKVMYHGKIGLLDATTGALIIPCEYDDIIFYGSDRSEGHYYNNYETMPQYTIAKKEGLYGLIDTLGKEKLPFIYRNIWFTGNDGYFVWLDNREGLFDKNLKLIMPPKYSLISLVRPGFYIAQGEKIMNLVSANGEIIVDGIQQYNFCGQRIIVKKDNQFGVVDFRGKLLVPFQNSQLTCHNNEIVNSQ